MRVLSRFVLLLCLFSTVSVFAQSAAVTGEVTDSQGAAIRGAEVRIVEQAQGTTRTTHTNTSGAYSAPFLNPGPYRIYVQAPAFSTAVSDPVVLSVGQTLVFNVHLKVGDAHEEVQVDVSSQTINTTDASVSTVVDRQFVENMPLNGRSFQSLILLSPGVSTTSPQKGTDLGISGEFSINGQRTDANSYTIDGLSANNGVYTNGASAGNSGSIASSSALGTTQALVSVDALQEFRITTSTYSAEYGRQPGGQIQFETRSGTNKFHGTLFDYLRNDALDANNWFNDHNSPIIAKPAERQNDFGGVFGGPIEVPRLYSGKDRLFFFLSYEGLRLTQPQPAKITYVPSNGTNNTAAYADPRYKNLRANAPTALQPVLNAFPLPNCTVQENPQCLDYGDGLSPYILSTSLPSAVNAISGRLDYQVAPWLRFFFRYADTTSRAVQIISTYVDSINYRTQSYSVGADGTFSPTIANQFRLGYSPTHGIEAVEGSTLDGAVPVSLGALQHLPTNTGQLSGVSLVFPNEDEAILDQYHGGTPQHQWNLVDTVSWTHKNHAFRAGIDYRRTTSYQNSPGYDEYPFAIYDYYTASNVLQNLANIGEVLVASEQAPAFTNFSAFLQDEWHVHPRLSLSLGVRWELNPPPSMVAGEQQRSVVGNFADPASLTLAPVGTPLYKTTYYNFAPRLGVAVVLHNQPGHELVFRSGGGVYFDTGQTFTYFYGEGDSPGLGTEVRYTGTPENPVSFPMTPQQLNIVASPNPPYGFLTTTSPSLQLPYAFQWNTSLEQAFGSAQSVTLSYVGSNGRRLVEDHQYSLTGLNPNFTEVERFENGLSSSYNALQVQYKRALNHGLQALASYTWSHAFDYESQDAFVEPYQRGNSDNDLRNNFNMALSYNLRGHYREHWQKAAFGGWGTDLRFTARTAFPVQIEGASETDPLGNIYYSALNYNGGPAYVHKPGIPGGRQYNPAVFSVPAAGQNGNSPRNFLRGFGENEVNIAVRREFGIYEQLHLQFRAEAFNLLNHPNFGSVNTTCGSSTAGATCNNPLLGQAVGTLADALGGLTQLYQQGGPRSLQLALKLLF